MDAEAVELVQVVDWTAMLFLVESLPLELKDFNVRGYQNVQHLLGSFVALKGSSMSMLTIQFILKLHLISRYSTIIRLICHLPPQYLPPLNFPPR